jgi:hypothetical protein
MYKMTKEIFNELFDTYKPDQKRKSVEYSKKEKIIEPVEEGLFFTGYGIYWYKKG